MYRSVHCRVVYRSDFRLQAARINPASYGILKRMKYELAKEIRDAGFPQIGNGKSVSPADALVMRRGDRVYSPTLSELIGSCGMPFKLEGDTDVASSARIWVAQSDSISGAGGSPEEAVARLWLALRKRV